MWPEHSVNSSAPFAGAKLMIAARRHSKEWRSWVEVMPNLVHQLMTNQTSSSFSLRVMWGWRFEWIDECKWTHWW
jgi:hypothetical protein